MRRRCARISLHPCLRALDGDQILRGAACREPAPGLSVLLEFANPKEYISSLCLLNSLRPGNTSTGDFTKAGDKQVKEDTLLLISLQESSLNSNWHQEGTRGWAVCGGHQACCRYTHEASWRRMLPKAHQVAQSQPENPELPTPCPDLTPGISITLMQLGWSPRMDALGSTREPSLAGSPGI